MNKREKAKIITRNLILEKTKELFFRQGIPLTTTAQIASEANIAHGTVFVHFSTKDDLVSELFISELKNLATELDDLADENGNFEKLLGAFLEYIRDHEQLFELYFREISLFSTKLKREIHSFEIAVRNSFFDVLVENGISEEEIPVILNMLFSQLMYHFAFKEVLCKDESVINCFGSRIQKTVLNYYNGIRR